MTTKLIPGTARFNLASNLNTLMALALTRDPSLTPEELAVRMLGDVSQDPILCWSTVRHYRSGARTPGFDRFDSIAAALECTVAQLLLEPEVLACELGAMPAADTGLPQVPELPPGYEVVESDCPRSLALSVTRDRKWVDIVDDDDPPASRGDVVALCWQHWTRVVANPEWVSFIRDMQRGRELVAFTPTRYRVEMNVDLHADVAGPHDHDDLRADADDYAEQFQLGELLGLTADDLARIDDSEVEELIDLAFKTWLVEATDAGWSVVER